jgi:hypothetical protein
LKKPINKQAEETLVPIDQRTLRFESDNKIQRIKEAFHKEFSSEI